jgi:hypothetical protein
MWLLLGASPTGSTSDVQSEVEDLEAGSMGKVYAW